MLKRALPGLPEGWAAASHGTRYTVIDNRHGGVTIDWQSRGYRGGFGTTHGKLTSTGPYLGRGWRQRLVADAAAWLQGIYETRSAP
jgi:hypothetical protein